MSLFYILNEKHEVIPCDDIALGAAAIGANVVSQEKVGDAEVSTVFLAIMHPGGMLFETMVFGGKHDRDQWRYRTWDEAVAGHRRVVEMVQAEEPDIQAFTE